MSETQVHEPAAARADGGPTTPKSPPASDSMFKNAYFLMLSTGVSAVLGLGFWLVAARYYSEEAVGQGSAAIAAMRLLASITATTMIGAVVRFVPLAGRTTASLVWRAYAASSVVVAVAAVVFLLTLDLWGASYAPLGTTGAGVLFVAACVAWALLTLQDGVLTGLRKAEWVPAGNAVFSAGKLGLLIVFATTLPVLGIFVSWAVAIAFSTLPLGWLIFRRLIPRQAAADRHMEPPRLRDMGRFLAGDSLGALFSLAMINLLPVMVAVRFSAAENGFFYVAYTVGGTMEFMAINMASSLTAHASHDPRQLADGVRGALRRMALLLVPVILVLVVFAPQILAPFDEDYAEHGSTVLRLLAAGALPRVAVELYIGVLRVQGRTGALAVLQGTMCTLVLGSAAVLFASAGIAGAGWAVLGSMTLMALVCVPGLRSALRGTGERMPADLGRAPAPPAYGTRWARLNETAGYGTNWARRAAYEHGESREDTVTLFIGHPGYEREALEADTLALIVRPNPADRAPASDLREGPPTTEPATAQPATIEPATPEAPTTEQGTEAAPSATDDERVRHEGPGTTTAAWERRLRLGLWALLGASVVLFCAVVRGLPWLSAASQAALGGRELLEALPLGATAAAVLMLLVYVAAATLCSPGDVWLPGSALGAFTLALYAAPVALGREPRPVGGELYAETAGSLARALGLDGPGPLLRWAPPVLLMLCLVPLWSLLARAGGRLPWAGRWGVMYLAAVGGWGWRQELAPLALPLFVLLVLLVVLALLLSLRRGTRATEPAHHTGPNETTRN
ncbi:lipopolysaccharide biosynthesis protein [Streptomyces sp. HUCO-GS316]|uniref:lipopolysaccharide biosynthesis protein n=1 Tax=Streptomyces sp. HUCO-GS316 TaxID=2692198 RepID=UPI00136B3AC7|nr:lipopolysaccharide biosynthesis protein [Streptomyces sp. HUCO-GS316]